MEIQEKTVGELSASELQKLLNKKRTEERESRAQMKQSYEQLRNDTVDKLIPMAATLRDQMVEFKRLAFAELGAVYEVLKEYSSRHADGKGNFEVKNADGSYRIRFRNNEFGYFDERSTQAEKHIIEFLDKQFAGDAQTRELLRSLLQRGHKNRLDVNQVQRLYKFEDAYEDVNWREGIKLLKESWTPANTKWYAMFEVLINDTWTPIVLNFASYDVAA